MTYAFQIDGIPRTGGKPGQFSYSKADLPTLNEAELDEQVGLDDAGADGFRTSWWCAGGGLITSPGSADGPLDWNCNGSIAANPVSADINLDSKMSKLSGFRDWGHLVFDGGSIGVRGTEVESAQLPVELTYEQYVGQLGG